MAEILGWTLLFLALVDVAVNQLFRYPRDNHVVPSALVRYFDFGRSIEGKLRRMAATTDRDAAPVVLAGWLARECAASTPPPRRGTTGVTIYGMSFTDHLAKALTTLDGTIATTSLWGPAASLNHSYACFRMRDEANRDPNPVQIIGILASSVDRMLTLTGMTTSFEAPMPFTYPRYISSPGGDLIPEQPTLTTPEELRDPQRLKAFTEQLARSDRYYDAWLFNAGIADDVVLARMIRRAYAQREKQAIHEELVGAASGYRDNPEVGLVMRAILKDFAMRARAKGKVPIVVLLQDRPGLDSLYRLLGPSLEADGIPYVTSHELVRATDPANFIADGHFTADGDQRVALRTLQLMRAQLAGRAP